MARFASEEVKAELIKIANQLIENGKGLLAADEGHPVVGARLEKVTEVYYCRVRMKGDLTQIMYFYVLHMTLEHRTYHITLLCKSLI